MSAPGPFFLGSNGFGDLVIYRKGRSAAPQRAIAIPGSTTDEAERAELVSLLNKGTHFEGLVEALVRAEAALERHEATRDSGAHDATRVALAAADGEKEDA